MKKMIVFTLLVIILSGFSLAQAQRDRYVADFKSEAKPADDIDRPARQAGNTNRSAAHSQKTQKKKKNANKHKKKQQ